MRVFKYRGGPKKIQHRDIRSLAANQIYAASFESLNDLFEARAEIDGESFRVGGLLSSLGLGKSVRKVQQAESQFIQEINDFSVNTKKFGIYSLSTNAVDEILWAHYADSHKGFCLEFELEELFGYKLEGQEWFRVKYQNDIPVIRLGDFAVEGSLKRALLEKFVGTKSKRWEYEAEVRVVTGQVGAFEYDFRALKAVYFGARSSSQLRRLVMRVMMGRGLKYFHVQPHNRDYKLQAVPIEDCYPRDVIYLRRVAPVDPNAPYVPAHLEPHRPMLEHAIEIVRREPYCDYVHDACLSSKGSTEDPVYFVTYQRSDGNDRNFFISRKDILSRGYI